MFDTRAFDLYDFVHYLTSSADWIEEVSIFGSRRYIDNASYGSDIDLLFFPNRPVLTDVLRSACHDPYVDPFLVDGDLAISAANETRIRVKTEGEQTSRVDAITLWTRSAGWATGEDYRILQIIPDKVPSTTIGTWGARPFLLFCALREEYEAVVRRIPDGKEYFTNHLPLHYVGRVSSKSGKTHLVVVTQTGVASVQAGIATARMMSYFDRSPLSILLGITAALKEREIALGDVLIPKATQDVESGKKTPKGKEPAGLSFQVHSYAHAALSGWANNQRWGAKWSTELSGTTTTPKIHDDCVLACTASVIAFNEEAQSYRTANRKIAGIEMEAVGVGTAAHSFSQPFLVVKAVSDFADEAKDDRWHSYCCDIAADLVVSALESEVFGASR